MMPPGARSCVSESRAGLPATMPSASCQPMHNLQLLRCRTRLNQHFASLHVREYTLATDYIHPPVRETTRKIWPNAQAWEILETKVHQVESGNSASSLKAGQASIRDPDESARRTDKLRALTVALARVEERERKTLAQDLHEDLGQLLAVVALKLSVVKKLNTDKQLEFAIDDCSRVIDQVNHKLRTMALRLGPPILNQQGLVPSLHWLADEVRRFYGIEVGIEDDGSVGSMDSVVWEAVFRAVRELLLNVYQHAAVQRADITVAGADPGLVVVTVSDAGSGLNNDTIALDQGRAGYGLLGIRERLGFLGGEVVIRSTPGAGTTVVMTVPLQLSDSVDSRRRD